MGDRINIDDVNQIPSSKNICVDANVLHFLFFPDFRTLRRYAPDSQGVPDDQKIQRYARWVKLAKEKKCNLVTSVITVGEFIRTAEHAVLYRDWLLSEPPRNERFNRVKKSLRSEESRSEVENYKNHLRKSVDFIPYRNFEKLSDSCFDLWKNSNCDFFDALMIQDAKQVGIDMLLTDDADFSDHQEISVFTGNRSLLRA